jgi:REP element-mobilizing transposase RayT/CheY-like chemotaxis protein
MVQQSLEETGKYKTILVPSAMEALSCLRTRTFSLAILDADMQGQNMRALAQALKMTQKNLCLIVIPPDNNPQHSDLAQVAFDGFLTKPFYLPDLLDTVAEGLSKKIENTPTAPLSTTKNSPVQSTRIADSTPDWLKDVTRAAQHLTRLSLESSAQAALIVRQGELWAYAGQLSQPAAQEVAAAVVRFWMDGRPPTAGKSTRSLDMVRVVRLNNTGCDTLLYVTPLGRDMVLALAFDAETPFSKIRSQASHLARSLASPIESRQPVRLSPASDPPAIQMPEKPFSLNLVEADKAFDEDLEELEGELPPINLLPLLDNVPPPDPKVQNPRRAAVQRTSLFPEQPAGTGFIADRTPTPRLERASTPAQAGAPLPVKAERPDVTGSLAQFLTTLDGEADEAGMQVVAHQLRTPTPAVHGLFYVCLMIPRMPQHHLTGDLANALSEMFSQLCLAYGWRLEHIAMRPDYLEWITSVPPTTSPSYLMRVLRQQTSQRIFESFPTLRKENPSGDFWAPGYLIMSGAQQPPAHIVKEFIQQTRQHQGASLSARPKV